MPGHIGHSPMVPPLAKSRKGHAAMSMLLSHGAPTRQAVRARSCPSVCHPGAPVLGPGCPAPVGRKFVGAGGKGAVVRNMLLFKLQICDSFRPCRAMIYILASPLRRRVLLATEPAMARPLGRRRVRAAARLSATQEPRCWVLGMPLQLAESFWGRVGKARWPKACPLASRRFHRCTCDSYVPRSPEMP